MTPYMWLLLSFEEFNKTFPVSSNYNSLKLIKSDEITSSQHSWIYGRKPVVVILGLILNSGCTLPYHTSHFCFKSKNHKFWDIFHTEVIWFLTLYLSDTWDAQ